MALYRNHFDAHCGMEVVLANGDLLRTGMGALPGAQTWQQFKFGVGPWVDGIFSQSNFGIVTKMGFWLMPMPDAYLSGSVSVTKREDLIPLVDTLTHVENVGGATGMPNLGPAAGGGWNCSMVYYGPAKAIAAQWEFAKEKFAAAIPGATFRDGELFRFPLTAEQKQRVHKPEFGIPSLEMFSIGARSDTNPTPSSGHMWFSPIIPRTGEAVFEAQRILGDAVREMGSITGPFIVPTMYWLRAFVLIIGLPITRNVETNRKNRAGMNRLITLAAEHGWGEYRTPPVFQDAVMGAYSFNNHALLRFHETIKDAVDPNGILAAGRYGIWPKHLRATKR